MEGTSWWVFKRSNSQSARQVDSNLCFVLVRNVWTREYFFIAREKKISTWLISYLSTRRTSIDKGGKVLIDPYLPLRWILSNSRSREFSAEKTRCIINDEFQPSWSIVNFAERTSREKKMIAARRPRPTLVLRHSSSTISRPSLNSPVSHDAYSQLKIIIVRKKRHVNFSNIAKIGRNDRCSLLRSYDYASGLVFVDRSNVFTLRI